LPGVSTCSTIVANDYERFRATFGVALPRAGASSDELLAYYRQLAFTPDGAATGLNPLPATDFPLGPPVSAPYEVAFGVPIEDIQRDVRCAGGGAGAVHTADGWLSSPAGGVPRSQLPFHLQWLSDAMAAEPAYAALFSDDVARYSVEAVAARIAGPDAEPASVAVTVRALRDETLLHPFQAVAMGAATDERGAYMVLALFHPDEATAEDNATRLRDRVAEGRSWIAGQPYSALITEVETRVDGFVLIARLRSDVHGLWYGTHAAGDALLLMGE
jgi:hypothetical protein